jgi:hypothetical protein
MAVPKKYQLRDFVNLRLLDRLGMFMMLITSLKEMICIAVITIMMYKWPAKRAAKKPPIIMNVHIVLVIKVCFFFSNSDCGVLSS